MDELIAELKNNLSFIAVGDNKRPIGSWKESQTRALTEAELAIKALHNDFRCYGIVTGYDGLEAIDVDLKVIKNEKKRAAFWNKLMELLGDHIEGFLDKVVIYQTMNHGYHILYKSEQIEGNQKLAAFNGEREAIIETRGIGGYVVRYEKKVSEKGYAQIGSISKEDRDMIIDLCRHFNNYDPNELVKGQDITPWDDYNSRHTVWELIQDEFTIVSENSKHWVIKRNGAESPHSGYIYKDSGCMLLFSTGTQYTAGKLYSAYGIYVHKYHGGDAKAASRELYRQGHGSRRLIGMRYNDPVQPIDEADLVFPIDVFPNPYKSYIMDNFKTSNLNVDFMGASLLWVMSVIIGNSMQLQVKNNWFERCRLWIACVADRGIGKSPSAKVMISPLSAINKRELANYKKEYDEYSKKKEVAKKGEEVTGEPKRGQFIVGDITIEALADLHQENQKSIGMNKDELAGWVKDMNKYRQGSDVEFWLSSFNGEFGGINRKTSSNAFIESPFISVFGGIQPSVLTDVATEQFQENGFLDRLLVCFPKAEVSPWSRLEVPIDTIQWYDAQIKEMYEFFSKQYNTKPEGNTLTVCFGDESREHQIRLFDELVAMQRDEEQSKYMVALLAKQQNYYLRFCLIINTIWAYGDTTRQIKMNEISVESALRAERLTKYFIAMSRKVKNERTEIKSIKQVAATVKGNAREKFKAMYAYDKKLNRTHTADLLEVSVRTITNWIKEEEKNLKT